MASQGEKSLNKHGTLYMLDHCSSCLDDDGISKLFNSLIILTTLGRKQGMIFMMSNFSTEEEKSYVKDGFMHYVSLSNNVEAKKRHLCCLCIFSSSFSLL